ASEKKKEAPQTKALKTYHSHRQSSSHGQGKSRQGTDKEQTRNRRGTDKEQEQGTSKKNDSGLSMLQPQTKKQQSQSKEAESTNEGLLVCCSHRRISSRKQKTEKEKDARERKRRKEEELKSSKTTSITFFIVIIISLSLTQYSRRRSNRNVSCDGSHTCLGVGGGGVYTPNVTRCNAKGNGSSHLGDDGGGGGNGNSGSGVDTSWCPGHRFDCGGGGGGGGVGVGAGVCVDGHRCIGASTSRKRPKCHQGHRQRREQWDPTHRRRRV
ncbi:hypothetical protein EDC96DRAFT_585443, partial [Choanephora cucurbitarum]